MRKPLLLFLTLLGAGCASVPREDDLSALQKELSLRGAPEVTRRDTPLTADDPQARALLEGELTADEAVAVALRNNGRVQVTLAQLGVARGDLLAASTINNPAGEVEIRFPGDPYKPFEFRIAQSLVDLIQLPRRRELGRAVYEAARLEVAAQLLDFTGDVRATYYDLLAATQHVAMARTNAAAAQAAADVAIRQHRAQNITDLDLENEQALYEQSKLDLARAEENLLLAREALIRALGIRDLSIPWSLPDEFPPLPAEELSEAQIGTLATSRRLDIRIARQRLAVAERQAPIEIWEEIGEIEGDIHHEREPDGARTTGPGIEFPIPIFNRGAAARARAKAELIAARESVAAISTTAESEIRAARHRLMAARARVEYYRDVIVPRRQRIVELTKLEHNAMLVGIFQLLQAKQNEATARREFIEAQRDYWTARSDFDRALNGVGMEETSFAPAATQQSGKEMSGTRGGH